MSAAATLLVLALAAGGSLGVLAFATRALRLAEGAPGVREATNRYAWLLGREVEARLYPGSGWERYVVVAVGWHGSVCVRRAEEPQRRGWWVKRWAWEGNLRVDGEVL